MNPCIYSAVGFAGHIPGYRDEFGHGYGMTVSRLLSLPHPSDCGQPSTLKGEVGCHLPEIPQRNCSDINRYEAPRFQGYMMPGYAGFIPCSHNYFGKNYQYPCQPSFSKLNNDRRRHLRKTACCQMSSNVKNECAESKPDEGSSKYEHIRRCMESQNHLRCPLSSWPYEPHNCTCHPDTTMLIPGYAGFVPFERGVYGLRYAKATKEGLRRFNKCVKEGRETICLPSGQATMDCSTECERSSEPIYLEDQGFMNSYTGHLPGHKYRFGQSFGRSTRNLKSFLRPQCNPCESQ